MSVIGVRHLGIAISIVFLTGLTAGGAQRGLFFSPHNFSASRQAGAPGYGSSEVRICIFCHTPHHARAEGPLWSRDTAYQDAYQYQMYASPTMTATINPRPTGASRLCLGCHDGTIAVGTLAGGYVLTPAPAVTGNARIALVNNGKYDLSGDHPISFIYPVKTELAAPSALPPEVKLGPNNSVECTVCHDPHSNEFGSFLVKYDPDGTQLCTSCHLTPGWVTAPFSIHKTTNTQGCGNCHQSHKSPGPKNLLKSGPEEKNCILVCHQTVATAFSNLYVHPVTAYNDVHKGNEVLPATDKHVKCVDCHNPHRVTSQPAPAPPPASAFPRQVSGLLSGVRGISSGGAQVNPAQYEYEVCYRCHSGAATAVNFVGLFGPYPLLPTRIANTVDERQRFTLTNLSYHPVVGVTNQPLTSYAVKSLIVPTTGTIIYCSDCHISHGSQYPHLFRARYDTYSEPYFLTNYYLCYLCHNEAFVMNPLASGFTYHQSHVNPAQLNRQPVPCSGCHDPHGVVANYHLINFDTTLLPAAIDLPVLLQTYISTGPGQGSCTVSCHTTGSPNKYTHVYP